MCAEGEAEQGKKEYGSRQESMLDAGLRTGKSGGEGWAFLRKGLRRLEKSSGTNTSATGIRKLQWAR